MTLESEFRHITTITQVSGRTTTKTELYRCNKCFCVVNRPDRMAHRDVMHPRPSLANKL